MFNLSEAKALAFRQDKTQPFVDAKVLTIDGEIVWNNSREYTPLDHIVVLRGAYAQTSFINDVDVGIELVASVTSFTNANQYLISSFEIGNSSSQWGFNDGYYNNRNVELYTGGNPIKSYDFDKIDLDTYYTFSSNMYNNGIGKINDNSKSIVLSPEIAGNNIVLFSLLNQNVQLSANAKGKSLKITKGSALIFDGIAADVGGEIGFYDPERNILISSTSEIPFYAAGLDYQPLDEIIIPRGAYIETQYINDIDMGVELVASITSFTTANQYLFSSYKFGNSSQQWGFNDGYYNNRNAQLYFGGSPINVTVYASTFLNTEYTYSSNLYNNGIGAMGGATIQLVKSPLVQGNNIVIFSLISGSNHLSVEAKSKSLKITKGEELLFKGEPSIYNGKVGFLDFRTLTRLSSTSGMEFIATGAAQTALMSLGVMPQPTPIEQENQLNQLGVSV